MKIVATEVKAIDLLPGDLFSTVGPSYWEHYTNRQGIGERVYIRTDVSSLEADDADTIVFKIEIKKEE